MCERVFYDDTFKFDITNVDPRENLSGRGDKCQRKIIVHARVESMTNREKTKDTGLCDEACDATLHA